MSSPQAEAHEDALPLVAVPPGLSLAGRAILAAIALMLATGLFRRYLVIERFAPLEGWWALDFLRLNLGYNLLVLLWSYLLLQSRRLAWLMRLLALLLVVNLVGADVLNSMLVFHTGAVPPVEAAYYMAEAADVLPVPLATAEQLSLIAIPLLMVLLAFYCWRQIYEAPGQRRRAWRLAAAGAALLLAAAAGPLADGPELSLARPSYLYHFAEYLKRQTYQRVPAVEEIPPRGAGALRATGAKPHNLVIIALESVGAGATGLYEPELREATPYLQSLAASSWVADQAYAVVPHTSKALVAINCGRTPYPLHPIFESNLGLPGPCLAEMLRPHGYTSVFFQSPSGKFENRPALVEKMGFDLFLSGDDLDTRPFQIVNYFGFEDEILLAPSRRWLEQRKEPFFSFYLTGTTHHPYWPPDRYGYVKFDAKNGDRDRFLNGVRYLDRFVRNVIEQHKEQGLYENTIFVILGDHGESLGEHSRLQHNASMYQEVVHIPLLIHAPGILPAARSGELFSQLDLLPSLLPLLGFAAEGATEGISHFPLVTPRQEAKAQCWYEYWCLASVEGRYKYIFNFDQKAEELYDLAADPHERNNLAPSLPEIVEPRRRRALEAYYAEIGRWEAFYRTRDPHFWGQREASLGDKVVPLALPPDDRRLGPARQH